MCLQINLIRTLAFLREVNRNRLHKVHLSKVAHHTLCWCRLLSVYVQLPLQITLAFLWWCQFVLFLFIAFLPKSAGLSSGLLRHFKWPTPLWLKATGFAAATLLRYMLIFVWSTLFSTITTVKRFLYSELMRLLLSALRRQVIGHCCCTEYHPFWSSHLVCLFWWASRLFPNSITQVEQLVVASVQLGGVFYSDYSHSQIAFGRTMQPFLCCSCFSSKKVHLVWAWLSLLPQPLQCSLSVELVSFFNCLLNCVVCLVVVLSVKERKISYHLVCSMLPLYLDTYTGHWLNSMISFCLPFELARIVCVCAFWVQVIAACAPKTSGQFG